MERLQTDKISDFRSYFWSFDDGARLEIMNKPKMEDVEKTLTRTGYIHIAFSLGSKEAVDELTAQMKNDGYEVISGPRTTGDITSVVSFLHINLQMGYTIVRNEYLHLLCNIV